MLLTVPGWTPAAAMGVPALALDRLRRRSPRSPASSSAASRAAGGATADRRRAAPRRRPAASCCPLAAGAVARGARALVRRCRRSRRKFGVARRAPRRALRRPPVRRHQRRHHRRRPAAALHRHARHDGDRARRRPAHRRPEQRRPPGLYRHQRRGRFRRPALASSSASSRCPASSSSPRSLIYGAVLRFTPFGRYVYAIGGNEEAARLSGIDVGRVKIVTYAISGMLAGIAAVLYVAQYRQGKPDAGAGLELDAIAAVVIGGTSLMGGRGGLAGTLCRRADLRPALQHPAAPQHQLQPAAGAEGPDHRRHRARSRSATSARSSPTCACRSAGGAHGTGRRERPSERDTVSQTRRKRRMKRRDFLKLAAVAAAGSPSTACLPGIAGRARRTRNGRSASRRRPPSSRGAPSSTRTSSPRPRSTPRSS